MPSESDSSPSGDDLKPYGQKAQWWLLPLPSVLTLRPFPGIQAVVGYASSPCESTAMQLLHTLVSARDLPGIVRVLEYGAKKYTADNWKNATWNEAARREYVSAIIRHLSAPEDVDPESGLLHRYHAGCSALFIYWHEVRAE